MLEGINIEKDINKILDQEFLAKLPNKNIPNNNAWFICFSSMPETGYSELAKKIAGKYSAILVGKDHARTLIYQNEKITDTSQPENILDEYGEHLMKELTKSPNKLIVWDASVDRRSDKYQEWAKEYGYKVFVIKVEADRNIIIENIKKNRDEQTAKWFAEQLDRWEQDHKNYTANGQIDAEVNNNSVEDINELFIKLGKAINEN